MESHDAAYSPTQALADADEARVRAAGLLRQPVRFHAARGVLAALALSVFAVRSPWVAAVLIVVVIAGMALVDRWAVRVTGAQAGSGDVRRFWPANQRTVLVAALVCIVAMVLIAALDWPAPVRFVPAVGYGLVWAMVGIRGDRARLSAARTSTR